MKRTDHTRNPTRPRVYRVTGPQAVHDTRPGDTFTAVLDPGQEAFLVTVGHIEIVGRPSDGTTESADSARQGEQP
jgi:hypothetical protein